MPSTETDDKATREQAALVMRGLSRTFHTGTQEIRVLNGIDLTVERKATVAITGPSGVGKSTLLHILAGLDRPSSGEVSVLGMSLTGQTDTTLTRFRRTHIGFVFQAHYLMDDFTALENVMMPLLIDQKPATVARERAELLLSEVGLTNRMHHRPRQLSGGEQQRTAVARALANDPSIVLADEPSGNLDVDTGRRLHELLFSINADRGITFVIATHNRELANACDREYELADGRARLREKGKG